METVSACEADRAIRDFPEPSWLHEPKNADAGLQAREAASIAFETENFSEVRDLITQS
jgi:hypothetical protein